MYIFNFSPRDNNFDFYESITMIIISLTGIIKSVNDMCNKVELAFVI
jgi:hypothetical protein